MQITRYHTDYYDPVVDFITRLNDEPRHHIAYLGQDRAEIRHELDQLSVPMADSFQLAEHNGRLVGVMGYDADPSLGRVWLMGPFVDHPEWSPVAGALYAAVLDDLPAGLLQLELFGHIENTNLAGFASANGFYELPETHLLALERPLFVPSVPPTITDFRPDLSVAFAALHEAAFPNTYYSAEQLIGLRDDAHRLLVAADGPQIAGYAFVQISPLTGQAYLDFIAVAERARGRGVGRALLEAVFHEAFAHNAIGRLELTVHSDNSAACRLYLSAGFEVVRAMRGYRRMMDSAHVDFDTASLD